MPSTYRTAVMAALLWALATAPQAQSGPPATEPAATPPDPASAHVHAPPPALPAGGTGARPLDPATAAQAAMNWQMRNGQLIKRAWGVEVLGVRLSSSKWMLNFRYKVLDAAKAKPLLDAKSTAYLVDEASGARLAVPAMENIGELRQTTAPKEGREYFIMFGNGSQVVQRGSRVDVVIGGFHADGLIVE